MELHKLSQRLTVPGFTAELASWGDFVQSLPSAGVVDRIVLLNINVS